MNPKPTDAQQLVAQFFPEVDPDLTAEQMRILQLLREENAEPPPIAYTESGMSS